MENKKYVFMLLMLLAFMITISAVSAAEDTASDIASIEENEEISLEETPIEENALSDGNEELILEESPNEETLNIENDNHPLSEDAGNFTALKSLINNNTDPEISLNRDYTYLDEDELENGIPINRTVTINGNGFTINANGKARIFHVTETAENVVFKNITFIGGQTSVEGSGGAIWSEVPFTAINCKFTSNNAYKGGAMSGGNAINCSFNNNRASSNGGALYNASAQNSNFTENYARHAGGAICVGNAINCSFKSNTVDYTYGGAMADGTALNCSFENNSARYGGAGAYIDAKYCNFTGNYANLDSSCGGALYESNALDCYFSLNRVKDQNEAMYKGAAINCTFNGDKTNFTKVANNVSLIINNSIGYVSQNNSISAKLIGGDNSYFPGPFYITVIVYKDGQLFDNLLLRNGERRNIYWEEGNYTATASVENFPEFGVPSFDMNITKGPSIFYANNITADFATPVSLYATLKEDFGDRNPIHHSGLIVELDGVNISGYQTKYDGSVSIPLGNLSAGIHNASISLRGHSQYADASINITINITKIPAKIDCDNSYVITYNSTDRDFSISLTDSHDNILSDRELTINLFDGEKFITNESGYATVSSEHFNRLSAGSYNATITYAGDENHTEANRSVRVIINQEITQLFADNVTTSLEIGKDFIITLKDSHNRTIPNANITVYLEDVLERTTDGNGQVIISTEGLKINEYTAFIFFDGNENYTESRAKASIKINPISPVLSVITGENTFGEYSIVQISLSDANGNPIVGNVTVTGNWTNQNKKTVDLNESGKAEVSFIIIDGAGTYSVNVTFEGNENCTSAINGTEKITITKDHDIIFDYEYFPEDMLISFWNAKYDDTDNLITGNVTGVLTKDGEKIKDLYCGIVLGGGSITLPDDLELGNYIAYLFLNSNDGGSAFAMIDVEIREIATLINITTVDISYGENAKINFTFKMANGISLNGKSLNVTVGDFNEMVEIRNGVGNITVPNLSVGEHNVIAVFEGFGYCRSSYAIAKLTVEKATPILSLSCLPAVSSVPFNVMVKLTDKNMSPIKGSVLVSINHLDGIANEMVELDDNGEGQASFSIDPNGTFDIIAKFLGDECYSSVINDTEKAVIADDYNITFDAAINEDHTDITITGAKDKGTGQTVNGELIGSLINDKGNIMLEKVTLLDGKGTIKIPEALEPGTYRAFLVLQTDDEKYAFNYDIEFTVAKLASVIDVKDLTVNTVNQSIEGNVDKYLSFTLKDSKGNALANKDVQVKMDGILYNLTTDANGLAGIKIDLSKAKAYNLAICYLGDEKYEGIFEQAMITVQAQESKLAATAKTYLATLKGKLFTASLKDAKGNALAGKEISFTVNGKTYSATTNAEGLATVELDLTAAKTYTVSIKFAGDSVYAASSVSVNVKLDKEKTKITAPKKTFKKSKKVKKLVINLKNSNGKALAKKKLTLTVNKKKYTAKTNKKGKATFKITNLKKKGTIKYTVKFAGDTQYKAVKKTGKIKIK